MGQTFAGGSYSIVLCGQIQFHMVWNRVCDHVIYLNGRLLPPQSYMYAQNSISNPA